MDQDLNKIVSFFLDREIQDNRPVLLAYSGGSDSTALHNALIEYRKRKPLNLHLVHVDHRWREESTQEALALQQDAALQGIPFYLEHIESKYTNNLEMRAREFRYERIKEVYDRIDAQALILAHQGEDRAETVLKKLFEGAHFLSLSGMKKISNAHGMVLWRPMLGVSKKTVIHYLTEHRLTHIDDRSNGDPRFLRPRFRLKIIPDLEKEFGKSIGGNLAKFASTMEEIESYFERKINPYLERLLIGKLGAYFDFNSLPEIEELEFSVLLKKICQKLEVCLSFEQLVLAKTSLLERKGDITIDCRTHTLFIDRGMFYFLDKNILQFSLDRFETEWREGIAEDHHSSWVKQLLSGELTAYLPLAEYRLALPDLSLPCVQGGSLKKWFSHHKTPSILRGVLPCVTMNGVVVHEFITGKRQLPIRSGEKTLLLKIAFTISKPPLLGIAPSEVAPFP